MRNKGPGLFGSFIGVLIGLGLVVIVSPFLLWQSQSQDRAKEFQTAEVVSADTITEGYVIVEGEPAPLQTLNCPRKGEVRQEPTDRRQPETEFSIEDTDEDEFIFEGDEGFEDEVDVELEPTSKPEQDLGPLQECVFVTTALEEYQKSQEEVCGDIDEDQVIIERLPDECDDSGNCDRCYLVEEYDWNEISRESEYSSMAIGKYQVAANSSGIFVNSESFTDYVYDDSEANPIVGDQRYNFTFMPLADRVLVAGHAESDGAIEGALDNKPFVISELGYDATVEELEKRDKAASIMFIILSLVATVLGAILIVGPITYLTNVLHLIPIVGKHADKGFDGVVKFFAVLVGLAFWALTFVMVFLAKNIIVVLIVLGVIGAIVLLLVKRGKIDLKNIGKPSGKKRK